MAPVKTFSQDCMSCGEKDLMIKPSEIPYMQKATGSVRVHITDTETSIAIKRMPIMTCCPHETLAQFCKKMYLEIRGMNNSYIMEVFAYEKLNEENK